jgi:hypothetical protein
MWGKIRNFYNRIWLFGLAFFLIGFLLYIIWTMIYKSASGNLDSIALISIVAIVLSFPGIVNTLADEFNPKKKTYKLSCRCPKCKYLIQMDMKEE